MGAIVYGMTKLLSVDLFSGVGGNSLALHSVLKTVAYCEIDPFARTVLEANMTRRRLTRAPVFPDVTTLKAEDIPHLPDVITASFPCQDISVAGTGAGLEGARSGLVRHVLRLVDEFDKISHSVSYLFFENSSHIRNHGLSTLVSQLEQRKFACVWCDVSAASVGARHIRRRWFMLATRAGAPRAPRAIEYKNNFAALDSVPRLVRTAGADARAGSAPSASGTSRAALRKDSRRRIGALGNAVVPTGVSVAWNRLRSADVARGDLGSDARREPTWPALKYDKGQQVRQYWPTPVHHPRHWYPTNRTDGRYFTTFGTRVFHEVGTMRTFRYTDVIEARSRLMLNPVWVETLMGFPAGWTAV